MTPAPARKTSLLPSLITNSGPQASLRALEFFTARIRNPHTRSAYARAVGDFCAWAEARSLPIHSLNPVWVAGYIESLERERAFSKPSIKQHLAAIRMFFDYLVTGGVLPANPAASVRGPRYSIRQGKTPVLTAVEARQLLDSIDTSTIIGLRDRALIATMIYSFARISAAVAMRVEDYFQAGKRWKFRFLEKGGKYQETFVHHNAEAYLDAYLEAGALWEQKKLPLFRSIDRTLRLSPRPLHRTDALRMVKRRALAAGFPDSICNHTFRATGITAYLTNGGRLEVAQHMAGHESARTTGLYDRRGEEASLDEVERIAI